MNSSGTSAVVVGASMAGMLAARALSDICERVIVLERDVLPQGAELRPGVPQARHLHVLLPRGRRILERYFPGITSELTNGGAEILDIANDIAWLTPQGWGVRFASEFEGVASTRALLDHMVRVRLKQVSNVEIRTECDVTGLAGRAACVEGVKLLHRNGQDRSETEEIAADLVVVTTGRNSALPGWLHGLGLPAPETTYVNANIGYATQVYRRPQSIGAGWRATFLQAAPPANRRAGVLFPVEGNRWMVTLQGAECDYPPLDRPGFLEFARSLRNPLLYEAIRNAEPLGSITGYRSTENQLFHYERMKPWPDGLFVLGDSACAFNPVYGQGMTTAALAAEDLAKCLKEGPGDLKGVARSFQQQLSRINRAPWMLATSEDLRYPGVEGATAGRVTRQMHRYMDRVLRSATNSVAVRRRFLQVQGMVEGPSAVFHPSVLLRVAGLALAQLVSPRTEHATDDGQPQHQWVQSA